MRAFVGAELTPKVFTGQKMIALCISEPSAGSDVASLQTTMELTEDGEFVLSGEKKWITCAAYADYFTVACRTRDHTRQGETGMRTPIV